jgi:hypothetical protein
MRMVLVDFLPMDETFWMRYRDIGLVGIVFVIPSGKHLSFFMC